MKESFYITTTLPYVNSDPHIGFAAEIVHADILARHAALSGKEVFFNTGTDEHGIKIWEKAREAGKDAQAYVDEYAEKFRDLKGILGLSENINFIRTTDAHHEKAAQEFWKRVDANGFIYKKNYKVKYCVGCELEKTDSELVDGKCPIHPNREIELIEEENYFFKFSAFKEKLEDFYAKNPAFVVPDFRFNEIKAFVSRGLEDFSISRLKSKMPWGVAVPGDSDHVMYVWFDALVNYISALGWPEGGENFAKFWGTKEKPNAIQVCGKDNLRQQSAMWQAMLMAADLPNSKQIIVRGFVVGENGQKMSKSLGNVINPLDVQKEYGTEALRYFLAREIDPFEDTPVTLARVKETYNSGLANGVGNLLSRVVKMSASYKIEYNSEIKFTDPVFPKESDAFYKTYKDAIEKYAMNRAMDAVWACVDWADRSIQQEQPFKKIKTDQAGAKKDIEILLSDLIQISEMLAPFMPETSAKIVGAVKNGKMPETSLFPRKD